MLQSDKIYKNAIQGEHASSTELQSCFKNMDNEEIIKLILNKGEVQISDREREMNYSNIKNDIANLIVEKTYNYNTGLPFPPTLILQVLNDIHFVVKEELPSKVQAKEAIKFIQEKKIIPIERKYIQVRIRIKQGKIEFNQALEKINKFLVESNAKIDSENKENINSFDMTFCILPNYYRDLFNKYEECMLFFLVKFSSGNRTYIK